MSIIGDIVGNLFRAVWDSRREKQKAEERKQELKRFLTGVLLELKEDEQVFVRALESGPSTQGGWPKNPNWQKALSMIRLNEIPRKYESLEPEMADCLARVLHDLKRIEGRLREETLKKRLESVREAIRKLEEELES